MNSKHFTRDEMKNFLIKKGYQLETYTYEEEVYRGIWEDVNILVALLPNQKPSQDLYYERVFERMLLEYEKQKFLNS